MSLQITEPINGNQNVGNRVPTALSALSLNTNCLNTIGVPFVSQIQGVWRGVETSYRCDSTEKIDRELRIELKDEDDVFVNQVTRGFICNYSAVSDDLSEKLVANGTGFVDINTGDVRISVNFGITFAGTTTGFGTVLRGSLRCQPLLLVLDGLKGSGNLGFVDQVTLEKISNEVPVLVCSQPAPGPPAPVPTATWYRCALSTTAKGKGTNLPLVFNTGNTGTVEIRFDTGNPGSYLCGSNGETNSLFNLFNALTSQKSDPSEPFAEPNDNGFTLTVKTRDDFNLINNSLYFLFTGPDDTGTIKIGILNNEMDPLASGTAIVRKFKQTTNSSGKVKERNAFPYSPQSDSTTTDDKTMVFINLSDPPVNGCEMAWNFNPAEDGNAYCYLRYPNAVTDVNEILYHPILYSDSITKVDNSSIVNLQMTTNTRLVNRTPAMPQTPQTPIGSANTIGYSTLIDTQGQAGWYYCCADTLFGSTFGDNSKSLAKNTITFNRADDSDVYTPAGTPLEYINNRSWGDSTSYYSQTAIFDPTATDTYGIGDGADNGYASIVLPLIEPVQYPGGGWFPVINLADVSSGTVNPQFPCNYMAPSQGAYFFQGYYDYLRGNLAGQLNDDDDPALWGKNQTAWKQQTSPPASGIGVSPTLLFQWGKVLKDNKFVMGWPAPDDFGFSDTV